jgi:transcriptional regulator with XRE-family HTH domain
VDASEPLGVKLRRLRKERGLSLTDFADKVGVSRPTVWSWETGKTKPRRQKLDAVAATLNLMDDELILDIAEVEERTKARSLEREISAAKARIAKIAGTLPEAVDITIRW